MIATLTLNPALDQTVWLERLETGEVNRVRETHLDAAGKGVNASRMIHRLGWPTIALGFLEARRDRSWSARSSRRASSTISSGRPGKRA
jgi:1-phosphofructokinase